ncbi:MAG: hypothetical protein KAI57_03260 [Candidatus Pacebacteria bacterium]|nr:hypothetical protein [Candidatus Paceibacterota bacterium]
MKFVQKTTWKEVFQGWKDSEVDNPEWIYCATKIKGWPDWESWRNYTATQGDLQNRNWSIFEFENPIDEVSKMLIGPFSGWQSQVQKKNLSSFSDLINIPKEYKHFKSSKKIISILKNQSFNSNLIGIVREDINQIVCIEGHHRATALAIAKKEGIEINFDKPVRIALARLPKEETFLIDRALKKGSCKV